MEQAQWHEKIQCLWIYTTTDGLKQYFELFFKYSLDTLCKEEN